MLRSGWSPLPAGPGRRERDQQQQQGGAGTNNNTGAGAYLAFKGGNNTWNHGHLDQGGFVAELAGVRWGFDLGSGNYGLPGYFGGRVRRVGMHACLPAPAINNQQKHKHQTTDFWGWDGLCLFF